MPGPLKTQGPQSKGERATMTGDTEDRAVLYHQIDPAHKLLAGILRDTGKDQVESSVQVASMLRNGTGMGGN